MATGISVRDSSGTLIEANCVMEEHLTGPRLIKLGGHDFRFYLPAGVASGDLVVFPRYRIA